MKVGEFVRTREYIRKIRKIEGDYIYCDIGVFTENEIIKSSPQIIDLIEVGDYVNGSWVNEIIDGKPYHEDYNDPFYSYYFENDDIKTIITHEQMEAMQYRVEE